MITYPLRVTILCVAVGLIALGAFVALAIVDGFPDLVAIGVLSALALYAGNRAVDFPDGTKFSAGFMIEAAAVVIFAAQGSLLGPLIVGMCCGLSFVNVRDRDWRRVSFNVGNFGLATLAAAFVFSLLPVSWMDSPPLNAAAEPTAKGDTPVPSVNPVVT